MDLLDKIAVRSYLKRGKTLPLDELEIPAVKYFRAKYWNRKDVESIIPENKHREQQLVYERALTNMEEDPCESNYLNTIL